VNSKCWGYSSIFQLNFDLSPLSSPKLFNFNTENILVAFIVTKFCYTSQIISVSPWFIIFFSSIFHYLTFIFLNEIWIKDIVNTGCTFSRRDAKWLYLRIRRVGTLRHITMLENRLIEKKIGLSLKRNGIDIQRNNAS
jgi:hypothetical protein